MLWHDTWQQDHPYPDLQTDKNKWSDMATSSEP
jgi:hypothetical protein